MSSPFDDQIEEVRETFDAEVTPLQDGSQIVKIPDYPLPTGWNQRTATIWFRIPVGYPFAPPDSFWTDADLLTASGAVPANTAIQQPFVGLPKMLWFSWHTTGWHPQRDRLVTFVRVIRDRMRRAG